MPLTTAGLPYPVSTDAVAAYPAVAKQLALSFQSGSMTCPAATIAANAHQTVTFTFPYAFAAAPGVVAVKSSVVGGSGPVVVSCVQTVTTTSAAVVLTNLATLSTTTSAPVPVRWVAIGQVPPQ